MKLEVLRHCALWIYFLYKSYNKYLFLVKSRIRKGLYIHCAGGYNGEKDGYAIPAGTDIFLSVSKAFKFLLYL